MPPILLIINILAIAVSLIVLSAVSWRFRKLFALGAFIPLAILAIITLVSQGTAFGMKEVLFFVLRGGLIFAVFSGLLTCYLVSRRSQATRDD
ncbi:MAG TPA: hypothetical protein PLD88_14825 [Candidatus Berkiella sp.]|nr:hypothetical protein [Candidatus Berkiella sp.]